MSIAELAAAAAKRKAKRAVVVRPKKNAKFDYSNLDLTNKAVYARLLAEIGSTFDNSHFVPFAVNWVKDNFDVDISSLPDFKLLTLGKLCFIDENSGLLSDASEAYRKTIAEKLINEVADKAPVKVELEKKLSVQDHIAIRTHDLIAEIEEWIDTNQFSNTLKSYIKDNEIKSLKVDLIEAKYMPLLREITDSIKGVDSDLIWAYRNYSPKDLKSFQGFLVNIIKDARDFVSEKISTRKPRAKKAITPDKMVRKLKYLARDDALGLSSIDPKKAVDSEQLWVFNVKTRFVGCYRAAPGSLLQFKGSTVLNFDEKLSVAKKLRKPQAQIKELMNGGKVALRTYLSTIKAKEKALTGRINDDTLLLRVL